MGGFLDHERRWPMVAIDYIRRAVLAFRKNTVFRIAFARALGIRLDVEQPKPGTIVSMDAYDGMSECFANHGSPMDGRR